VQDPETPTTSLDAFLAGVERRAFRRAQFATRDRDEALDLVQDAMLRLARSYAQRPAAEWPALFQRILTHRIRDWQRRRTVQRRIFFWRDSAPADEGDADPIDNLPDAAQADGSQQLERDEVLARLTVALAALPGRQREAFELRIWEGLGVEATAQAMGCSAGSVKTHLSRALHSLREDLEGVWP
jgi:RNA polymerase sigma-70 factor (ECF subfamily)